MFITRQAESTAIRGSAASGSGSLRPFHVEHCSSVRIRQRDDGVMDYITVRLPVRLWQRVDASVDNSMAIDAVNGFSLTLTNGACVRDAGWRASAEFDGERTALGWPAAERELSIVLRREHWEWALDQLNRWSTADADNLEACERIEAALRSA